MEFVKRIARSILPLTVRNYLRDKGESVRRAFPGTPHGLPHLGLTKTQIYPNGINFDPVLLVAMREKLDKVAITKNTAIASIGTCFAEEFAFYMRDRAFNYIVTEPDALSSSANWGRVYTIPNLHQIVHYSFDPGFDLCVEQNTKGWFDPLREQATSAYATRDEAIASIKGHREASRKAFSSAAVLIMTVGQNEAWVDQRTRLAWGRMPSKDIVEKAPDAFAVREFGYEENRRLLTELIRKLFTENPVLKIIVTVSPVPSHATFSDIDVVSQSFANKCLLRAVVQEVIRDFPEKVFYFPSFEMVLGYNPDNFKADNRHVKHATVARIFRLLEAALVDRKSR